MSTLIEVIKKASPEAQLKLAKMVRKLYVAQVRETKVKLDPKLLRAMDAKIKEAEAQLN